MDAGTKLGSVSTVGMLRPGNFVKIAPEGSVLCQYGGTRANALFDFSLGIVFV